ncbi:hypothetical protein DPMN_042640 [Dreissena polymorpha]|uniref:Uncharacterized protein n=1 Tax=Dreissena polymorpha TaxID=45954 RepID=A0A9D4CZX3_DREPO|nr:hypothetical protein DPMN_042640 [Dreissena polymorpha]
MLTPRIMKLHRNIDHDWQMTPIDFQVTRIMKLHRNIDHDWQMTPIDFQVTSSPEHNVLMLYRKRKEYNIIDPNLQSAILI